jgi:uncharacterized SAM-binding protein YcdF (DUF218 family)
MLLFLQKHFRRNALRIFASLLVLWCFGVGGLTFAITFYGRTDRAQPADVMILLGPPALFRVNQTMALWRQGLVQHILCTGGPYEHRPSLTQARDCYNLLTRRGVPADAIVLEDASMSTEENALYARQVMDRQGWRTAILVSDATHLLRATWLFSRVGIENYPSANPNSSTGWAVMREVVAFHWQVFKDVFRLPYTHIAGV